MVTTARHPDDLPGWELAAVAFVRDYVELWFDGPVLRLYSDPRVTGPDVGVRFPEPGSRDALCELIGHTVESVSIGDDGLSMALDHGWMLFVDFTEERRAGVDAAEFIPIVEGQVQSTGMVTW